MKIGLVSPYDFSYPGGVNSHISHLRNQFVAWGHDVRIIAPASADPTELARQNVLVVGRPRPIPASGSIARISISLRLTGQVKQILARERFDILHLHEPLLPVVPITVLRCSDTINIGTFHAFSSRNLGYHYGKRILKRWFRRLHGKIAVSAPAKEFVSQYFPGYYNIIPNGIDWPRFSTPRPRLEAFDDGKFNILFVGRLEKRKGFTHLLRAYAWIKASLPDSRLIVVGPDDQKRRGYQRWAAAIGLRDIHWVGYVSDADLPRYYQTADVFCSPATGQESFGIVLLEAMAAGTTVLATSIPGYASVVHSGEDGLLVPPKDDRALATAILRLAADPGLRRSLAGRGQQTAARYDWPIVARQVLNYYERLISEAAPARPPIRTRFPYFRVLRG